MTISTDFEYQRQMESDDNIHIGYRTEREQKRRQCLTENMIVEMIDKSLQITKKVHLQEDSMNTGEWQTYCIIKIVQTYNECTTRQLQQSYHLHQQLQNYATIHR
jgi:hypothetical protein